MKYLDSDFKNMRGILTSAGGIAGYFLGGFDGIMNTLIVFVCLDYFTGVMAALTEKRINSEVGARGIFKKVCIFMLVGMAHILDLNVIGSGTALRTAIIIFYLSNEGISIVENVARIGLNVPQQIIDLLEQLKDGN